MIKPTAAAHNDNEKYLEKEITLSSSVNHIQQTDERPSSFPMPPFPHAHSRIQPTDLRRQSQHDAGLPWPAGPLTSHPRSLHVLEPGEEETLQWPSGHSLAQWGDLELGSAFPLSPAPRVSPGTPGTGTGPYTLLGRWHLGRAQRLQEGPASWRAATNKDSSPPLKSPGRSRRSLDTPDPVALADQLHHTGRGAPGQGTPPSRQSSLAHLL